MISNKPKPTSSSLNEELVLNESDKDLLDDYCANNQQFMEPRLKELKALLNAL